MKSRLVIKSEIASVESVYNWVEKVVSEVMALTSQTDGAKTLRNILLITQEMVTNSILHGNREIKEKEVTIEITSDINHIVVDITDEGEGIKKLPLQEEAQELDYLAENGRGLKLAVLMTDKIELEGNRVRLIFKIS